MSRFPCHRPSTADARLGLQSDNRYIENYGRAILDPLPNASLLLLQACRLAHTHKLESHYLPHSLTLCLSASLDRLSLLIGSLTPNRLNLSIGSSRSPTAESRATRIRVLDATSVSALALACLHSFAAPFSHLARISPAHQHMCCLFTVFSVSL
jgi:hypothetical protein